MTTELYLARGIVEGRVHTEQDVALLRTVELALQNERRARRTARR
jgi:hypothetical protein